MEMTTAMTVLGVAVPLLGWVLWWWNDVWHCFMTKDGNKLPPGHMGFPIVGELLHFLWYFKLLHRPDDFINSKRTRYGEGEGMYRSYLFGSPCIIACSPSSNKFILQSDQSFVPQWHNADIVGEQSIIAVQGAAHARLRSFVLRSISHPDALNRIALTVQPRMIAALQSWADRGTITAFVEVKKITLENIGKYFASFEPGPTLDSIDESLGGMVRGIKASRINIPGTAYHYGVQCRKKVIKIFREELEKRKKMNKQNSFELTNDLLDGLMQLKDDDGKPLSDSEVLDNIIVLIIAGYDTTALAHMWAIYFLAKYPKVLDKLKEETLSLKSRKNGDLVTSDEIFQLKYMNKVVHETIRMGNASASVFRTAAKDVEYKGYTIPKGWKVFAWVRYLHTDPANFEDPNRFEPDRWDEPSKPGTFLAFGGGSRLCPGSKLARLQLSIFLYYLTTGYKWELVNPDAKVTYLSYPKIVDGVKITIKEI